MNPKKEAQEYFVKACQHQQEGQAEKAIELFQLSINAAPTAEAYTHLGWMHGSRGDFERAIFCCERAIELDPDYGNAYNDLGAWLIESGRGEDAGALFEKAIAAPRSTEKHFAHFNLGKIYEGFGRWAEALWQYQASLKERPGYEEARKAIDRLQAGMN